MAYQVWWQNLFGTKLKHGRPHASKVTAMKSAEALRKSLDHGLSKILGYKPKTWVKKA